MPTTREVAAQRDARQRRARAANKTKPAGPPRYYTAENLSPVVCRAAGCGLRLPLVVANEGHRTHPTCSDEWRELAAAAREAVDGRPPVAP